MKNFWLIWCLFWALVAYLGGWDAFFVVGFLLIAGIIYWKAGDIR